MFFPGFAALQSAGYLTVIQYRDLSGCKSTRLHPLQEIHLNRTTVYSVKFKLEGI